MAKIPELMSGRALEHDLKFASDGPMSGLVHGVQAISCSGATLTLKLSETSAAAEAQMKCDILSIDPNADADKSKQATVLLPAALTNGPSLAGRIIRVFNSADNSEADSDGASAPTNLGGELLILQESDGSHLSTIGKGDYVDVLFLAQDNPVVLKKLKEHTIVFDNDDLKRFATDTPLFLPTIAGVAYQIVSCKVAFAGAAMDHNGGAIQLLCNGVAIDLGDPLGSVATVYETAVQSLLPLANTAVTIKDSSGDPTGGDATSKLTVTLYYYEI
jgi:hypothetical protein